MTSLRPTAADPVRIITAITDATVWTGSGWRSHTDVLVSNGVVSEMREHQPKAEHDGTTLDATGGYLLPGFTNTHTHVQQSLCRGIGEGQPLLSWLLAVGEAMRAVTPERAYLAAVAASLEGLLSGTTTVIEHGWPHPDLAVWEAAHRGFADVGVRAVLGVGIADRPDPTRRWGFDPTLMKPLDEVLADVDRLRTVVAGTRTELALAVPNPRSLTPAGTKLVRDYATEHDMTVMIHLSETGTDDAMCREHTGLGAVEMLAEADFLWDRLLAVHGVTLSPVDLERLAEHRVAVSWNPVSNMRLGSGVAPITQMQDAGVAVGIGVDGAGSNDRQDMWETLRSGAYVQRAVAQQAALMPFGEMIAMACDGAASTLGRAAGQHPGAVTLGRPADLTLLRVERDFACLPVTDPGATLLTTGTPRIVDTVLVDGEVVVADGRSTRIDVPALTSALLDAGTISMPCAW